MSDVSTPESILKIEKLSKRFRHGGGVVEAVKAIDLTVREGEFIAIMGASGSGKSTLLHLIAGLTRPDEGSIQIDGTDIHALSDNEMALFRRKQIGLVFQAFNLIPSLTGEENIALPILLGGDPGAADNIPGLIDKLGLEGVHKRKPDAMSGGEQQRIAIGRALVCRPAVILADEPTGSLDSGNGRRLCDLFQRLSEESRATVLMVTHNPVVAFAASRFLILKDGELVAGRDKESCPTVQDLNRVYIDVIGQDAPEEVSV